jgi:hypothetical protein
MWVCWLVLALVWAVAGLFAKRTVERTSGAWRSSLLVRVLLIAIVGLASTSGRVGGRLWVTGPVLGWLLATLVVIGLAVALWAP